jgi:hypothetical protein
MGNYDAYKGILRNAIFFYQTRRRYIEKKLQHLEIQDAVDTVVCAPDDGWRYHPKHVEQFPDKINCVTLHLVGYIFE